MIILKEYLKPTNIYVLGSGFKVYEGLQPTINLANDYSSIDVKFKDKQKSLENEGHVYIVTEQEILDNLESINWSNDNDSSEGRGFLLENYIGLICLNVLITDKKTGQVLDLLNNNNFDSKEQLMSQEVFKSYNPSYYDYNTEFEFESRLSYIYFNCYYINGEDVGVLIHTLLDKHNITNYKFEGI